MSCAATAGSESFRMRLPMGACPSRRSLSDAEETGWVSDKMKVSFPGPALRPGLRRARRVWYNGPKRAISIQQGPARRGAGFFSL